MGVVKLRRDRNGLEPDSEQPAHNVYAVIPVRERYLSSRNIPEKAGLHHRQPRGVHGLESVLLSDLYPASPGGLPVEARQPLQIRRGRGLAENGDSPVVQFSGAAGRGVPGDGYDHELRPGGEQFLQ